MKVLAVETATFWQSVALLDEQTVLARHDQDAAGSHARLLLPAIDRLLKETGVKLQELDGLVVSIGPGSFTGLRVGLATLLGFRTVTELPLAVVPTLEAMAWNVRGTTATLCPILNSRKGEVYWGLFRWANDTILQRLLPERVGPPAAVAESLTGPTLVFGEGWKTAEADIQARTDGSVKVRVGPPDVMLPSAVSVGLAGIERLRRGETASVGVAPLYVQRAEAELKFEQSGGLSPVARRQERVARKVGERLSRARRRVRTE